MLPEHPGNTGCVPQVYFGGMKIRSTNHSAWNAPLAFRHPQAPNDVIPRIPLEASHHQLVPLRHFLILHSILSSLKRHNLSFRSRRQHQIRLCLTAMAETYPIGSRSQCERMVRDWGFGHVFTWSDGR